MKRIAGLALLVCLVTGLAYAQEAAKPSPYYPLKKGATWTYKATQGDIVLKVIGTDTVNGKMCWKLETSVNSKPAATELIEIREDGFYRHSINGQKVDTPIKFFGLPAEKGKSWDFDFKVQGQPVKGKFETRQEDVTVTAGVFKGAILVEGKDIVIGTEKTTLKQWFAEGTGIVKIQFSLAGQEATLDLSKFEPGN